MEKEKLDALIDYLEREMRRSAALREQITKLREQIARLREGK
jgi:hypothetical protein